MKRFTKSNKGFSMVELIIVIAIMAILIAVLAPQYLRYVEKTKKQSDESAMKDVVAACEAAIADYSTGTVAGNVTIAFTGTNFTITVASPSSDETASTDAQTYILQEVCYSINGSASDTTLKLKSKTYATANASVVFTYDSKATAWVKSTTNESLASALQIKLATTTTDPEPAE